MRFDIYMHREDVAIHDKLHIVIDKLNDILVLLKTMQRKEVLEMATIADIQAKVTEQQTVVGSVVTLLAQLAQMLKDAIAANDPAAIQAIADAIDANSKALADAVVANTPTA